MAKKWAATEAFTIIELLVSIVVIGILATIMIVSYSGIQQRARDNERGSDVTQIKIAIEKYHADKSKYPTTCGASPCSVSTLATDLSDYLKTIPHDPKYVADSASDYTYIARAAGDGYAIKVVYEAKPTCKTGENIYDLWWTAAVLTC